jgi:branched-chain amino acid transport system substrate-binding protein
LAVLALVALSAVIPPARAAVEPFEINAVLPQTGGGAFMGRGFAATLAVVADLVNKSGGIRGRPIKFVVLDSQSNPQIDVQLLNELIAKNVPVVIGPNQTAECRAALPLVRNGPVIYCLSPQITPGGFAFSAGITTLTSIQGLLHYFRERGWNKVGIIVSTDATGQDAEQEIDRAFAAEKAETVIDREHFNPTDISVAAQMSRIAASGAQVMLAWSTGSPFSTLLRNAYESGVNLPIAGSNGNLSYAQLEPLKAYVQKDLYFIGIPSAASIDQLPKGALKDAQQTYLEAFRAVGIRPEIGQYQIWDLAWIIVDAFKHVGLEATAPQVRDYIAGLRGWIGVHGTYDFPAYPGRGLGSGSVVIARWDVGRDTWVNASTPGGIPLK